MQFCLGIRGSYGLLTLISFIPEIQKIQLDELAALDESNRITLEQEKEEVCDILFLVY